MQCRGISNEILRKKGGHTENTAHTTTLVRNTHNKKSKWFRSSIKSLKHQSIKTLGHRNAGSKQNHLNSYICSNTNILICTYQLNSIIVCTNLYMSILWWSLIQIWNNQFSLVHSNPLKTSKNVYPTRLISLLA